MERIIKAHIKNRRKMLLVVAEIIKESMREHNDIDDDIVTCCQFFMQQDMTGIGKEELLHLSDYIRQKIEDGDKKITDEYIIREVLEKDVERIVRPDKQTFFDRNIPVIKNVLEKKGIKYLERHPGFDITLFEMTLPDNEDKGDATRIEVQVDRVYKLCKVVSKNKTGQLLHEETMDISVDMSRDQFLHMFENICRL